MTEVDSTVTALTMHTNPHSTVPCTLIHSKQELDLDEVKQALQQWRRVPCNDCVKIDGPIDLNYFKPSKAIPWHELYNKYHDSSSDDDSDEEDNTPNVTTDIHQSNISQTIKPNLKYYNPT